MSNEYKKINYKIDGKQSYSIPIEIKKNGKLVDSPLHVSIKGVLKFEDSSQENIESINSKTIVYPVIFSTEEFSISNGRCVMTLLPRSEDLFETTASIQESISAYSDSDIKSSGIVSNEILLEDREPVKIKIETGVIRNPYWISIQVTVYDDDGNFYSQTVDRGISPQTDNFSDVDYLFYKSFDRIPSNIVLNAYNNEDWVPVVDVVLGENNSTSVEVIKEIRKLKNSTSFGLSTMYDAIITSARLMSDNEVSDVKKVIYLFTDNEANISTSSVDNSIEEVNDIDGLKKVPVMIGNMNIVTPRTLSVKSNSSDTKDLNQLAYETGGQSITVSSESHLDDLVVIFYREAVGSMGYGTYEFSIDIGEEALINYMDLTFEVASDNSSARWEFETSVDGYNYVSYFKSYDDSSGSVEFTDLTARYIRYKITFVTGFNSETDEYGLYPESPSLLNVRVIFNKTKIAYLYLAAENTEESFPFHVTVGVDANEINKEQIDVGLAKSDSINWEDYYNESQPVVNQNGKIVVPLRFSQDIEEFSQEPLKKVDNFILKTEYGRWDLTSIVMIYDKDDNILDSSKYTLFPRDGIIILNSSLSSDYVDGDYKIGIIDRDKYKIGLKLRNKTREKNLEIYGVGYVYTTSKDLLPPISKASPEARSVSIINESPNKFSKIEATYIYYDSNFDEEYVEGRKISWYINGVKISYLDGLLSWNDINDPNDPIYQYTSLSYPSETELQGDSIEDWIKKQGVSLLSKDDIVYFEIQVTDGELYSSRERSNTSAVVDSVPIVDQVSLKGMDVDGNIVDRITADTTVVFYPSIEESLYADSSLELTEIVWYVNDEVFKKGRLGDGEKTDGTNILTIKPNEVGTGDYVDYALRIGNDIFCQITPRTSNNVGETLIVPSGDPIVVQNALPRIYNLNFVQTVFKVNRNIILTWNFYDFEIIALKDVDATNQRDLTTVEIYRKNSGSNTEFEKVYIYNNHNTSPITKEFFYESEYEGKIVTEFSSSSSSVTISSDILTIGQQWYAVIIPNDSIDMGTSESTKIITIVS